MRNYELTLVVATDVSEEELNGVITLVRGWIEAAKGSVPKVEIWGRRKLAYPIEEFNEGHYVHLECVFEPQFVSELERNLKLAAHVLRHLVIRPGE